jgi:hypothetical protein
LDNSVVNAVDIADHRRLVSATSDPFDEEARATCLLPT